MVFESAQSEPNGTATARGPLLVLFCTLLALLAWLPSARLGGWAYDDLEVLENNPVVQGDVPARTAFEQDYWAHLGAAGHYRPLATLTLRADLALSGLDASALHRTNALLHTAVVMLAGVCLVLLGVHAPSSPFPWIGLAIFAVHPALADSVAWISGRTSMLSALGGLLGSIGVLHLTVPWRDESVGRAVKVAAASAAGLLLALLGKEDGVIFAPCFVALGALHSRRSAWGAVLGSGAGMGLYFVLRFDVYGTPWPSAPHAPLADASLWERALVGGRSLLEALRLTLLPVNYPPIYERWSSFRDVEPWIAALGWCAWSLIVILGTKTLRQRSTRVRGAATLLACASFLPLVQLVPAGVLFAPRFLYLPLLFGCLAVDALFRRAFKARAALVASLAIGFAVWGAWLRTSIYESKASFYEEQLRHVPDDAPAYNELALACEAAGDLPAAKRHWQRAIELDPTYGRPWSNLGRLALAEGDEERAERALRRATELGRGNALAHANLGAFLLRKERFAEALTAYERATRLAPSMGIAWRGQAKAHLRIGQLESAQRALLRARDAGVNVDEELRILQREVDSQN